jgi:hypothetical protein
MSTSPFFGIRAFDAAHITPTGMVDPVLLTDYVSNNLLHCADQTCARVLVNDMSPVSSLTGNSVPQYTSGGYDSTQWRPIAAYGPFPLSDPLRYLRRGGYIDVLFRGARDDRVRHWISSLHVVVVADDRCRLRRVQRCCFGDACVAVCRPHV